MEVFKKAKTVRLKSHHDKYLMADEDEERVYQDRNGSASGARWSVDGAGECVIRLKSCYGCYLTASNEPLLLGMTGCKVVQSARLDSSVEWEPVRDGFQVRLKTRHGRFLRANGGLPPWRNTVTHDIPHRTSTQDWVLWDVEIIEVQPGAGQQQQPPPVVHTPRYSSSSFESSPESTPSRSRRLSREESSSPSSGSRPKSDGRSIHCVIAEDDGSTENATELCFSFSGTSVKELTEKLEEITEMSDGIIVCTRNPLNGMLCPLRLHLPPNSTMMNVVVVPSSSKVARGFKMMDNFE